MQKKKKKGKKKDAGNEVLQRIEWSSLVRFSSNPEVKIQNKQKTPGKGRGWGWFFLCQMPNSASQEIRDLFPEENQVLQSHSPIPVNTEAVICSQNPLMGLLIALILCNSSNYL